VCFPHCFVDLRHGRCFCLYLANIRCLHQTIQHCVRKHRLDNGGPCWECLAGRAVDVTCNGFVVEYVSQSSEKSNLARNDEIDLLPFNSKHPLGTERHTPLTKAVGSGSFQKESTPLVHIVGDTRTTSKQHSAQLLLKRRFSACFTSVRPLESINAWI
jgi:hypothetical protein